MAPPTRASVIRRRRIALSLPLVAVCGVGVALAPSHASAAGLETTDLISATPGGGVGSQGGQWAVISGDGRYVAFASSSSDLVPGDTNNASDVFVRDTTTGVTTRVSVATGGAEASNGARQPSISKNGRFVAFDSTSPDLVGGDANASRDVFVHDRQTETTERVSLTDIGTEINDDARSASISGDGTRIAFSSGATNILPGLPGRSEIFVRDTVAGTTSRLTSDVVGSDPNEDSFTPQISADGGDVTFQSRASDLVPLDTNGQDDVFVRDLASNQTQRVSVDSAGVQGDKQAWKPSISDDGTKIAFLTSAALVAADTNTTSDVYVRDTTSSATTRHSLGAGGSQLTEGSGSPGISGDGTAIAFTTDDPGVVVGDGNVEADVFVRDSVGGAVRRVSVAADGSEGNGFVFSTRRALSSDGSRATFYSDADNLAPGDANASSDVFLRRPADPQPASPAQPASPPSPALHPGAPAAGNEVCGDAPERAKSKKGTPRYTKQGLKIQQNIDSAVIIRLEAVNGLLDEGVAPERLCTGSLGPQQFQAGMSFAGGGHQRTDVPAKPTLEFRKRKKNGEIERSMTQLQINERISRVLFARARATYERIQNLTGGNLVPGAKLGDRAVWQGLATSGAQPPSADAPAAELEVGRLPRKLKLQPNAKTVRDQQRRSQASITTANKALDALTSGLTGENFQDGSIGSGRF